MSSVNDIFEKTTELVNALRELVESETVQALPGVANQLGVTEILNDGIDLLVTALQGLVTELRKLDNILEQMAGIAGLLGLLEPLVGALGKMVAQTAENLAAYGLDNDIADPIETGLTYVDTAMDVIGALIVDPERFSELVDAMDALKDQFLDLKASDANNSEEDKAA